MNKNLYIHIASNYKVKGAQEVTTSNRSTTDSDLITMNVEEAEILVQRIEEAMLHIKKIQLTDLIAG